MPASCTASTVSTRMAVAAEAIARASVGMGAGITRWARPGQPASGRGQPACRSAKQQRVGGLLALAPACAAGQRVQQDAQVDGLPLQRAQQQRVLAHTYRRPGWLDATQEHPALVLD